MVAIMLSCCVFFGLMLDHAMAEEFVTKAEFESLKHRMDNLEASLGKKFTPFQRTFLLIITYIDSGSRIPNKELRTPCISPINFD